jgi:hypothetical protein
MKITILLILMLSIQSTYAEGDVKSKWDFDHNVRYEKTKISEYKFNIEVIRTEDIDFSQISAFIIRKSFELCSNSRFSIGFESGVELFDDEKINRNSLKPPLVANVECYI